MIAVLCKIQTSSCTHFFCLVISIRIRDIMFVYSNEMITTADTMKLIGSGVAVTSSLIFLYAFRDRQGETLHTMIDADLQNWDMPFCLVLSRVLSVFDLEVARHIRDCAVEVRRCDIEFGPLALKHMSFAVNELKRNVEDAFQNHIKQLIHKSPEVFQNTVVLQEELIPELLEHMERIQHNHMLIRLGPQ